MKSLAIAQDLTLPCIDGVHLAGQSWSVDVGKSDNSRQNRILCLHGWMDNCRSFHYLAPTIAEKFGTSNQSCSIVALDFPGHGLSSHKSVDGPPTLLADSVFYISEAVRLLQWESSDPFTIVGHSMGAGIGCLYAASFPEQVKKLVLLDGAGPLARNGKDVGKHVRQHVLRRQQGISKTKVRIYPSLQTAIETRKQTATSFPGNQYLSDKAAEEMVIRGTKKVDGGVQFIHDPRLQWPSIQYFTTEQVEGLYQDIQCPTALLLADDGWPLDQASVQRSLDLLKPVVYKTLPGSHHFHADPNTAQRVAEEVVEFIIQ